MPTIIDSLIVTLGLDPSNFTKGQKEAAASQVKMKESAEKSAKEVGEANKKMAETFTKIKEQVLSLTAVLLGGRELKEFTTHIIESDAAVGRLATNLGVATEDLKAYEGVAEKFGSSASDMDTAFRSVSKMMAEFKAGKPVQGLENLIQLGVDPGRFFSPLISNLERVRMLQEALTKKPADLAQLYGASLGLSENLVTMLRRTNGEMDDLVEKQKTSNRLTKEQADNAEHLEEEWNGVKQQVEGIGRVVLNDLNPALSQALHWLEQFFTYSQQHIGPLEILLTTIAAEFTLIGVAIGGVTGAIIGLGGALAAGIGLGTLINKFFTWLTGNLGLGSWLYDQFNDDVAAKEGLVGGGKRRAPSRSSSGKISGLDGAPSAAPPALRFRTNEDMRNAVKMSPEEKAEAEAFEHTPESLAELDAQIKAYKNDPKKQAILQEYAASLHGAIRSYARNSAAPAVGAGKGSTTSIGTINVYTQATDAKGIARDINSALNELSLAGQANGALR